MLGILVDLIIGAAQIARDVRSVENVIDEQVEGIPCLHGVLAEQSRVLGWQRSNQTISFLIEASVWPGHPAYEPRTPAERGRACYKRAKLVFDGIEEVEGLVEQERVEPYLDSDGIRYYGYLWIGTNEHGIVLDLDFDNVFIKARSTYLLFEQETLEKAREQSLRQFERTARFDRRYRRILLWAFGAGVIALLASLLFRK